MNQPITIGTSKWRLSPRESGVLGVMLGIALGVCSTIPLPPHHGPVTQTQADAALHWVSRHLPNTHFTGASPDVDAPGLVDLRADGNVTSMYFDPARHYLMLGLVINMDNPQQLIAPGQLAGEHP